MKSVRTKTNVFFHQKDFCRSIYAVPGVLREVFHNFVCLADQTKAAYPGAYDASYFGDYDASYFGDYDASLVGDVQGSLLGFIRSALKWCVSDEGVIDTKLVDLFTRIESTFFIRLNDEIGRMLSHDEIWAMGDFMLREIIDAFSDIILDSNSYHWRIKINASNFKGELVTEHIIQAIERPFSMHEQLCSLKKLTKIIKDSNDPVSWEYLSPPIDDALDIISWLSLLELLCYFQHYPNSRKRIDSTLRCQLLDIWVCQSGLRPNFTNEFLEGFVDCIQQHLIWLLEEHDYFVTDQAKKQISIMQDLLKLVLSLFNNTPEHESLQQILSHTKMHVYPLLTKLGDAIHSFTPKAVNGEYVSSFEISDWFTKIFQALCLPLDSDCLLSNETMIKYAHYYRHYLFGMPTHLDIDGIYPFKHEYMFDKDLVFVAHVVYDEWSSHHIEREILLNGRVQFVGVLRGLGSIMCASLNNGLPIEMNPGFPDILAKFELLNVLFTRNISLHILKDLRPQVPRPNPLLLMDIVCENLKEIQIGNSGFVEWNDQLQTILDHLVAFISYIRDNSIEDDSSQNLVVRIANAAYDIEYIINASASEALHGYRRSFLISNLIERCGLIEESIFKRSSTVLLPTTDSKSDATPMSSRASSVPPIDAVVGFKVAMKLLMKQLAGDKRQLDAIPIVGMPGIGKTTLARKVFEDPYIANHFDICAWCTISQNYVKEELLRSILGTDASGQASCEELSLKVHKKLTGRKYLIILDDVWEIDIFNYLRRFFPNNNNGSRIVLTSRIRSMGDDRNRIELELLSDDESWSLLKQKVQCPSELCEIGKEISRKCGGLPLAVVVVAGILAKLERQEDIWKEIAEKLCIYKVHDNEGQWKKALDLSYELLPDHLKLLFLYIGAFPEDSDINASKLKRLWIAEGFIRKTREGSLEAEAEACLMDLIDRSLLMVGERKSNGLVKSCHVHDLIRDMCISKAKAENFMEHISSKKERLSEYLICQRRVSVSLISNKEMSESSASRLTADETPPRPRITHEDLSRLSMPTRLNSLLLFGNTCELNDIVGDQSDFENNKMLRVFNTGGLEIPEDWLRSLTLAMNLRYISLGIPSDSRIPPSLFRLWKLETLIIEGAGLITVPGEVWKMTKLRHLHIFIFKVSKTIAECCSKLENLQTLSTLVFRNGEEETMKLIGRFPNLVKLKCWFQFKNGRDEWPRLESLHQLQSLKVWWADFKKPCKQPQLSRFPSTLKKLSLFNFKLKWKDISDLQQVLPNLEILKLQVDAVSDELWDMGDGVFPKLKFLKLINLNIKRWVASEENFPCLQNLVLHYCKYLEEIPLSFGEINTLKKIEMKYCSQSASESAKQIEKEQIEVYGNYLPKVYISTR